MMATSSWKLGQIPWRAKPWLRDLMFYYSSLMQYRTRKSKIQNTSESLCVWRSRNQERWCKQNKNEAGTNLIWRPELEPKAEKDGLVRPWLNNCCSVTHGSLSLDKWMESWPTPQCQDLTCQLIRQIIYWTGLLRKSALSPLLRILYTLESCLAFADGWALASVTDMVVGLALWSPRSRKKAAADILIWTNLQKYSARQPKHMR
jgi:hypothetical protein